MGNAHGAARRARGAFPLFPAAIGCLLAAAAFAAAPFPGEGAAAGAKPAERLTFSRADLYGYIDGGAELFLEFGFEELQVQKYSTPDGEVALDLYRMATPEGALGIFLAKRGKETPVRGVATRNTGDRYQITALKGRHFAQANNFKGGEGGAARAAALLNALLAGLPDESPADLFAEFPQERRVDGSEALFASPFALQRLFTFGDGDILLQQGRVIGAAMDYIAAGKALYTLYRVPYPDVEQATRAFAHLRDHLDATIVITEKQETGFTFKDFSGKFGSAELRGAVLWLRTGLAAAPPD
jgi:hypothetical protein